MIVTIFITLMMTMHTPVVGIHSLGVLPLASLTSASAPNDIYTIVQPKTTCQCITRAYLSLFINLKMAKFKHDIVQYKK